MDEVGEGCGAIIAGVVVIALLIYAMRAVASAIYTAWVSLSYLVLHAADWLTNISLIPGRPEVMWAYWGAILGGVLAFYPLAGLYGLGKWRRSFVPIVFVAMVVVALVRQYM